MGFVLEKSLTTVTCRAKGFEDKICSLAREEECERSGMEGGGHIYSHKKKNPEGPTDFCWLLAGGGEGRRAGGEAGVWFGAAGGAGNHGWSLLLCFKQLR